MKKTLIALLLVGSSSALFAQNNPNTNTSTNADMNTTPTTTTTTDPATKNDASTNTSTNTDVNSNTNTNVNTDAGTNPNSSINSNANLNTSIDNSSMNNHANVSSISTGSYNAYGTVAADVPTTVRYSFQKEHPDVTGAQWYQTPNGQLRVMYKDANNQDMDVYYFGTSAQSYMVSLPLRQSLTSDDIVAKAKSMFGLGVYDINKVKAANMEDVYHIRLLDNGQVRSVWISEQGTEVAAADVFRTADVAENDIINEVNTSTPAAANSTNNTNSSSNSSNTTTNSSTSNMSSNSTDAGNTNNSATDNKTTTPSETTTETK